MSKRVLYIALVLALMALCGCRERVLNRRDMADVLFDIYLTQATIQTVDRSMDYEDQAKYYDSVFAKHGITKAEFDHSLEWYADNPREWQLVYDDVMGRTEEFGERVENFEFVPADRDMRSDTIDTLDMWLPQRHWEWARAEGKDFEWDHVSQDLPERRYFVGALRMELSVRLRFCSPDSVEPVKVRTMMVVHYSKKVEPDTSVREVPADSVLRRYTYRRPTLGRNVSRVEVMLLDSAAAGAVTRVYVDSVQLRYIYSNRGQYIADGDRNALRIKGAKIKSDQAVRQQGKDAQGDDDRRDGGNRLLRPRGEDNLSRRLEL